MGITVRFVWFLSGVYYTMNYLNYHQSYQKELVLCVYGYVSIVHVLCLNLNSILIHFCFFVFYFFEMFFVLFFLFLNES